MAGVDTTVAVGVIGVLGVPLPLPTLGLGVPLTPLPLLLPRGVIRMEGVHTLSLCLGVWESPLPPLHDFLLAGISFGVPVRYFKIEIGGFARFSFLFVMVKENTGLSTNRCRQSAARQYSTVQYSTVYYNTVQYSTIKYSTIQYSSLQYNMDDNEVCIVWDLNPGLKTESCMIPLHQRC